MDGAGSYSVAHLVGLFPTELTSMWGWILLRSPHQGRGGQGGFLVRSLVDGAGSYSVAHLVGLFPTELTGMWGWILLRSPHQGRGPPTAPAPTKQRPGLNTRQIISGQIGHYWTQTEEGNQGSK